MTSVFVPAFRRKHRTAAASLVLAASVAACAVGPDYTAPSTDLTPFHNLDAVDARQTATPAPPLDRWWTGFNDPLLVTVVQRSLDQNLDLAASLARVSSFTICHRLAPPTLSCRRSASANGVPERYSAACAAASSGSSRR